MKIVFILLFFTSVLSFTKAQTNLIIGKVTSEEDQQAIRDVKVYWKSYKKEIVRTNKDGVYMIPQRTDVSVLVFEYGGKKTVEKSTDQADYSELNIEMEEIGVTAVTASRWEQSVNETPASIVIITRDEIENYGYMTLQEVLESVPGVFTINHRSESDITLGIRGFWAPFNRNVMIQIDGMNMLSERQNDYPLNKINIAVEAIDRIEIVRGPMSVIYGAGAFFGVINIITNQAYNKYSGIAAVALGSQDTKKSFFRYATNNEGFKLSLNAVTYCTNGFKENWDDMVSEDKYKQDLDINNGKRTIHYYKGKEINTNRYSRNHKSIIASASSESFFGNISYAMSDFGFSFLHPGPSDRNDYKSYTLHSQFGFRGHLSNLDYEAKLGYMNSDVDATYKYYYEDSYTPGSDKVSTMRAEINTRIQLVNKEMRNNKLLQGELILGVSYTNNLENHSVYNAAEFNLRNWYLGLPEGSSVNTKAGYLQSSFKFGSLQFVAGGRLEKQSNYDMINVYNEDVQKEGVDKVEVRDRNTQNKLHFIPRVAIIYALNSKAEDEAKLNKQFFKTMYGKAIKQPTVVDNTSDIMGFAPFTEEKHYLKPEQIETFEFGYILQKEHLGLDFNLNLFRNDLHDLVTRESELIDNKYVAFSKNNGRLLTHGMELIVNKKFNFNAKGNLPAISKKYSLNAGFDITYQHTDNYNLLGKTELVGFSPPILGNIRLSGTLGRFGFGTTLNYVGKMSSYLDIKTDENKNVLHSFIGNETDGYFRLSANIRFKDIRFFNESYGGWYINIRGSNVLDKKYYYPTYTINDWADKGMLGRGRQFLFTIGYKYL